MQKKFKKQENHTEALRDPDRQKIDTNSGRKIKKIKHYINHKVRDILEKLREMKQLQGY